MKVKENNQIKEDILEIYQCYFDIAHSAFKIMNNIGIPKTVDELDLFNKCVETYEQSMEEIDKRFKTLKEYTNIEDFNKRQESLKIK